MNKQTLAQRWEATKNQQHDPFDMPPDHAIWLAINSLSHLLEDGYFMDDQIMEWKLNCMINELKGKTL